MRDAVAKQVDRQDNVLHQRACAAGDTQRHGIQFVGAYCADVGNGIGKRRFIEAGPKRKVDSDLAD